MTGMKTDETAGKYERVRRGKSREGNGIKETERNFEKTLPTERNAKEISEKYSLVAHLWEIAQGKETGINLERFVLGALLDAVTEKRIFA